MRFLHRLFGQSKPPPRPKVIVDFKLQDESLYLIILNSSSESEHEVVIHFDHPIMGHNGSKNLTSLPIFKNILYLAPFKAISLFIDPVDVFFYHLKQETICIETHYKDHKNCSFKESNIHNLNIYKQLPIHSRIDFLIEEL